MNSDFNRQSLITCSKVDLSVFPSDQKTLTGSSNKWLENAVDHLESTVVILLWLVWSLQWRCRRQETADDTQFIFPHNIHTLESFRTFSPSFTTGIRSSSWARWWRLPATSVKTAGLQSGDVWVIRPISWNLPGQVSRPNTGLAASQETAVVKILQLLQNSFRSRTCGHMDSTRFATGPTGLKPVSVVRQVCCRHGTSLTLTLVAGVLRWIHSEAAFYSHHRIIQNTWWCQHGTMSEDVLKWHFLCSPADGGARKVLLLLDQTSRAPLRPRPQWRMFLIGCVCVCDRTSQLIWIGFLSKWTRCLSY